MSRACLLIRSVGLAACGVVIAVAAAAAPRPLELVTTTGVDDTKFLAQIAPKFKQATGIDLKVLALSSVDAIEAAKRGDADILLMHDAEPEADKLVTAGVVGKRIPVMFIEFVLVGPKLDPAVVRGKDLLGALKKIDSTAALFISTGDQGITHLAEQRFWPLAGVKVRKGGSHRQCKCAATAALDIAAAAYGYTLVDRGAWNAFRNRGDLAVLVEGDPRLNLAFSVLPVNQTRFVKGKSQAQQAQDAQGARDAQKFVQWITSAEGHAAIQAHKLAGQQYFLPAKAK
jgi:tungstate transport system substrate-binding protein